MNAIDVRNIVKKFGDFTAVKGSASPSRKARFFGLHRPPTAPASRR